MSPFRRAVPSAVLSLLLPFLTAHASRPNRDDSGKEVLKNVRAALLDPQGYELIIRWDYDSREENWTGEGVLQILGENYLKLDFPDHRILVKHSTIMAWYRETDQVIIDSFNRRDPTNVFSLFLSGFDFLDAGDPTPVSDVTTKIVLTGSGLGAFQSISVVVDTRSWMPRSVEVSSGEREKLSIGVMSVNPLTDPRALMDDTLSGSSRVDLRQ